MGLSYNHEPPLEDYLTNVTTHHRYLPGGNSLPPKKRPYVHKCFCAECKEERLAALEAASTSKRSNLNGPSSGAKRPKGCPHRSQFVDKVDELECAELARDGKPLPGDYGIRARGIRKRPSFKREEAFRDPSTCKSSRTNSWAASSQGGQDQQPNGGLTDLEVAELYRLGILYDDEHVRGSGFNLEAIVHQEPVFSIRPAKRQRKHRQHHIPEKAESVFEEIVASGIYLPLDLSFADLGSDEAIAHLLAGSSGNVSTMGGHSRSVSAVTASSAPITVIYEVDENGEKAVPEEDELPELTHEGDGETQPSSQDTLPASQEGYCEEEDDEGWDILPRIVSPGAVNSEANMNMDTARDSLSSTTPAGAGDAIPSATTTPGDQEQQQDTWIVLGDDS